MILSPNSDVQATPTEQTTTGQYSRFSGSQALGKLAGLAGRIGYSQTPISDVPVAGKVVEAALRGASPRQLGKTAIGSSVSEFINNLTGVTGVASLGGSVASEVMSKDPNYGRAGIKSVAGTLGGVLGGMVPIASSFPPAVPAIAGATLAGYLAKRSLDDGYLGDMVDSRPQEGTRDYGEDVGFTVSETARMAKEGQLQGTFGNTSLDKTGQPASLMGMSKSEFDRKEARTSLAGYYNAREKSLSESSSSNDNDSDSGGGYDSKSGVGESNAGEGRY